MPAHDCFLTVDLYEAKDPAQVLQCIEAFSRVASGIAPSKIPKAVGGLKSIMSPQGTGGSNGVRHGRGRSNASDFSNPASGRASPVKSGRISPVKSGGPISPNSASSWGNKSDITSTAPAWNISQYGWTGGASQGNQGISFGARRQITSAAPHVPSLAEKERRRKEKAEEEELQRQEAEAEERRKRAEREAEEERAREEEEARWAEETRKLKEQEKQAAEAERRRWEEEERRWKQEEARRLQEEKDLEARLEKERLRKSPAPPEKPLRGQMLSQYQAEQKPNSESDRIRELERQLEEAKEREQQYERERQSRGTVHATGSSTQPSVSSVEATPERELEEDSIQESEPSLLKQAWAASDALQTQSPRPLPVPQKAPASASSPAQAPVTSTPLSSAAASKRPLPTPQKATPVTSSSPMPAPLNTGASPRPLPNPAYYAASSSTSASSANRTDRYLASNVAPQPTAASAHVPPEAAFSSSAEADQEADSRRAAQTKTKAGGWASSSLLEREMERERQRQREWEEGQKQTQAAVQAGHVDSAAGSAPGQSWDVHQYGYTGGDNLNKGAGGIYTGRRQILGPRPMGGKSAGSGNG
jgi:transgelin